jgi:protein-S-isoprenylcysteine O-methyltransferase Ste14
VRSSSPIPSLGPRGEGWVVLQLICLLAVAVLGALALPAALSGANERMTWVVIGVVLIVVGALAAYFGLTDLGSNLSAMPRPPEGSHLVQTGIYARIRHPIYAGLIEMSIGWAAVTGSGYAFAAALVLAVVLDLKSRREEAWLTEQFPEYPAYRRRTRKFIPYLY